MKTSLREIYDRKIEFASADNKAELVEFIAASTSISTSRTTDQDNMIYLESETHSVKDLGDCISSAISKWYNDSLGFDPLLLYNILQLSNNSCILKI